MSLKHEDLIGTILPNVSIDEFEPKAGDEKDVIVVAFYLKDEDPANDLNTFIQRGSIDTLDVEVSPNTDDEGRYLVFVEMSRDETFPNKFFALLKDVNNVAGKMNWEITTYYSGDKQFSPNDPELLNYLILDPTLYVTKDDFKMNEINEGIEHFFRNSMVTNLTIKDSYVTMVHNRRKIVAEVIDVGDYDTVIGRNFLNESAFDMNAVTFETKVLQGMLSDCQILPIGKFLCVSKDDKIMLLKNTQLDYGN